MAATPDDFLAEAKRLITATSSDVGYRSVIVSAYYGAYHAVVNLEDRFSHRSDAVPSKPSGSHEKLIVRLEIPHPQLGPWLRTLSKDLGKQMREIKAIRELASYKLGEDISVNEAEQVILMAADIISECKKNEGKV